MVIGYPAPNHHFACSFYASLIAREDPSATLVSTSPQTQLSLIKDLRPLVLPKRKAASWCEAQSRALDATPKKLTEVGSKTIILKKRACFPQIMVGNSMALQSTAPRTKHHV